MAVVDEQIGAGNCDAMQKDSGAISWADAFVYVHSQFSPLIRYHGGFVFTTVNIPQASTILAAKIIIYVRNYLQDSPNLEIYGNDVDSANNFAVEGDIFGRARTTASTSWITTNLPIGWNDSPDITGVVQELVDRPGWVANNDMGFLFIAWGIPAQQLEIEAFDTYPTQAAKLHIEYRVHYGFTNFQIPGVV